MTNFSPREIVSELDRFMSANPGGDANVAVSKSRCATAGGGRPLQLTGNLREKWLPQKYI